MPDAPANDPDRTARPIPTARLSREIKARRGKADATITRQETLFVHAGKEPPVVKTRVERVKRAGTGRGQDYRVIIEVDGVRVDRRASPLPLKGKFVKAGRRREPETALAKKLTGFVPDHLEVSLRPTQKAERFLRIRTDATRGRKVPTTVFAPDNRLVFQDTAYPWCTTGLVETNRGAGSGTMIGPRHLVTVSHVIDWTAPAGFAADWVRFTPSYFDGTAPFGEAYGAHIYWYVQEDGDGFISGNEGLFDYVVVVLDRRLGEQTGWMGARGYDDDWDSLAAWSHIGYPADLNSGQRPTFQGGFTMDGSDADAQEILHRADVFPGQSGGPMFGWWSGDVGPRVVAVQSWQNGTDNGASGSMDMRDLVALARTEFA
jgi:V8-like Glu-specific endopeptidase